TSTQLEYTWENELARVNRSIGANVSARSDASNGQAWMRGPEECLSPKRDNNHIIFGGMKILQHTSDKVVFSMERGLEDPNRSSKRERKTHLFKESLEQQRKLNEDKFKEFKEEMKEETNDNEAEALTQLKQQHANPHSV
ncbi:hypothetical protein Tco_0470916, partial [Tanacetum coccineum]